MSTISTLNGPHIPEHLHFDIRECWPQSGASSHGGANDASVWCVSLRGSGFFAHVDPAGVVPSETYVPSK